MRRRNFLTGGAAAAVATAAGAASIPSAVKAAGDHDAELVIAAQAVVRRWRELQHTDMAALHGEAQADAAVDAEMARIHAEHDRLMRMRPQTASGVLAKLEAHETIYRDGPDTRRLRERTRDTRFDFDWTLADHARELPGIMDDLERVAGGPIVAPEAA